LLPSVAGCLHSETRGQEKCEVGLGLRNSTIIRFWSNQNGIRRDCTTPANPGREGCRTVFVPCSVVLFRKVVIPLILWTVCLAHTGCRSLSKQNAINAEVVSCRQQWQQGLDAAQRGAWDQAERLFNSAVQTCPSDEWARQYYADALWRKNSQTEALREMQKAVELSGQDPQLLVRLGEMLSARGNLTKAQECAVDALRSQPRLASARALLGDIAWARGHRAIALDHYCRALSLQPQYPRVQFATAKICFQQRKFQQALVYVQDLMDATPSSETPAETLRLEGEIYMAMGRFPDAASSFQLAIGQGVSEPQIFYDLAAAEFQSGEFAQAQRAIQEALSLDVQHEPSLHLLARIQNQQAATTTIRR